MENALWPGGSTWDITCVVIFAKEAHLKNVFEDAGVVGSELDLEFDLFVRAHRAKSGRTIEQHAPISVVRQHFI